MFDTTFARDIGRQVVDAMEDAGYSIDEMIPGFVQAVIFASDGDDSLLDEAANLLADGGVSDD